MLKTPNPTNDPTAKALALTFGDGPPFIMQEGVITGGGFNADKGFDLSESYPDMYPDVVDNSHD